MAKSPEEMLASMVANMKEKTGKDLDEWKAILAAAGLEKHGQMIKLLKTEHGVTHGFANTIVHLYRESSAHAQPADDLVANQYSGKETLRPIYDALIAAIQKFGGDVELAPKKAYVSVRRKKQFALIQPSTKTRVDVGINSKTLEPTDRLEAAGKWNSMCSHRIRLSEVGQVDSELIDWLKAAYEEAG